MACVPIRYRRGSSPLARGTSSSRRLYQVSVGLIPARAGNTFVVVSVSLARGAHPRSRGEHFRGGISEFSPGGSSPLARGTQGDDWSGRVGLGLIPARAGNTGLDRQPKLPARAHPRSRGEHGTARRYPFHSWGSSPLARGTPPFTSRLVTVRWAHPRSRGEHRRRLAMESEQPGSSPLARGTP